MRTDFSEILQASCPTLVYGCHSEECVCAYSVLPVDASCALSHQGQVLHQSEHIRIRYLVK